jgi:ADP-L-glycero-D-manno-heptose 6-epimerase
LEANALGAFDYVFHLGACSATTERDAAYLIRNNYEFTEGSGQLVAAFGARFVYASSAANVRGRQRRDERHGAAARSSSSS